jgi:hypothetical protein
MSDGRRARKETRELPAAHSVTRTGADHSLAGNRRVSRARTATMKLSPLPSPSRRRHRLHAAHRSLAFGAAPPATLTLSLGSGAVLCCVANRKPSARMFRHQIFKEEGAGGPTGEVANQLAVRPSERVGD